MVLTQKQKLDLDKAVLMYLKESGCAATVAAFLAEPTTSAELREDEASAGLLEKKWTSIIRLQKKVMDLEARVEQLTEELKSAASGKGARSKADGAAAELLPRAGAAAKHVLQGHRENITSVRFHPIYNLVVTSSDDTTIKVWDYEAGQFERTLKGHTDAVQDVAFNEQGTRLASCSSDMSVKIWEFESEYVCQKTMHGHDHSVSSVAFVPSSDLIVSSSRDKLIKVWDTTTGFCVRTLAGHDNWVRRIRVSPCGQSVVSTSSDQTMRLWNLKTGTCAQVWRPHEHVIDCVAFSNAPADAILLTAQDADRGRDASSQALAHSSASAASASASSSSSSGSAAAAPSGGQFIATGARDKSICITRVDSGACVMTLTGHDSWVRGLLFHPSGRFLLSCSDDKTIRVWDLTKQGRCVRRLEAAHETFVTALDFASGKAAQALASGGADSTLRIWECV